jgi:hypothetical protein
MTVWQRIARTMVQKVAQQNKVIGFKALVKADDFFCRLCGTVNIGRD